MCEWIATLDTRVQKVFDFFLITSSLAALCEASRAQADWVTRTTAATCGNACGRCGSPARSALDVSRAHRASKVITSTAVLADLESRRELAAVSRAQAKDRLAGLFTGPSSYGTELQAQVASTDSDVSPTVQHASCHASPATDGKPPWRQPARAAASEALLGPPSLRATRGPFGRLRAAP